MNQFFKKFAGKVMPFLSASLIDQISHCFNLSVDWLTCHKTLICTISWNLFESSGEWVSGCSSFCLNCPKI